ncbi:nucleotide sugar dehydrogenase [Brevibacillus laterosporus]|uniref:nucleotide sugar dehydrogenase n=1 Tax=Brevibacillus laterosporus TaxID=1465 RepID=UPI000CE4484D|nr:nucleotide sugar dehydrogenase [Brevibacillus laterosporus]MBG9773406.1 capsular biosynthesis protein [Brevibacillus laterosporus]NKQ19504.1 nucleotide sugar dehydrogenase [Brevibacillus laterosporus]PPA84833.1 nucleotide sugar dehydrogenase [Brevibacillus laterosporus]WNX32288.1 nucleotide sugar dehydrogenase [Brevibacillus laterosporus]
MTHPIRVAVVGLGFVGLPLALTYAMKGAKVVGIDVSEQLVKETNEGKSHHLEAYKGKTLPEILKEQVEAGRFQATTSYEEAKQQVDHYIVTVGIPVKNGDPELQYLKSAAQSLGSQLKKGDHVMIRSTVIPGTTEEVVKPFLEEASGMKAGEDFYLSYCSERIAEGRAFEEFIHMPLALGGINEASAAKGKELLSFISETEITITDIRVVEASKVIENIQRDVNIAMVQEFARFAEAADIDVFELIKVANTHTRVNLLTPGPGVGGYCLPNALYYLAPKAKELHVDLPLLTTARKTNDGIPTVLVNMLEQTLQSVGKRLADSKVAVFGLAMKDFSNDDRISPVHDFIELLLAKGVEVTSYDPAVHTPYDHKKDSLEAAVSGADALVLAAMQQEFTELNWAEVTGKMASSPVVLDLKNRIPRTLDEQVKVKRI